MSMAWGTLAMMFLAAQGAAKPADTGAPQKPKASAPFACDLGAMTPDERKDHARHTKELLAAVKEKKALPNGYAFRFERSRSLVSGIADWMALESKCCPFLAFRLELGEDRGPMWMTLTGRPGVREFLAAELGL